MRIAPYWERRVHRVAGMTFRVRAFSFCSAQEAHERMLAKLQLLSDFYGSSHHGEDSLSRFRHSLRELDEQNNPESYSVVTTEQILQCMDEQNIITRNRYGVQVLNTSSLCILDVDSFLRPWKQRLLALFGGGMSAESCLLAAARSLVARDERLGLRVYRTARGWRIIAGGRSFAPDDSSAVPLQSALQVDPLYARLCVSQKCWRARLTPKPYRLGMPCVFPELPESGKLTPDADRWIQLYEEKSARIAVCRLVDSFGEDFSSSVLDLHDEATRALHSDLPLG